MSHATDPLAREIKELLQVNRQLRFLLEECIKPTELEQGIRQLLDELNERDEIDYGVKVYSSKR